MVASYIVLVKTIYLHNQSLSYTMLTRFNFPLKSCYHAISINVIRHLPIANPFHRRAPFHLTVMIAKSHVALLVNNIFSLILYSRVQTHNSLSIRLYHRYYRYYHRYGVYSIYGITPYTHARARIPAINDKHNVKLFFAALVLVLL